MNSNTKKINDKLILSKKKAVLLFICYQSLLYFLYIQTNLLDSEALKGQSILDKYTIWESLFMIVLIGPLVEEFVFRCVLFKLLANLNIFFTLVISSALWAILHFTDNAIVPIMLFFLGWILGVLRIQTNSMFYPFILHALNNAFFIFFLTVIA